MDLGGLLPPTHAAVAPSILHLPRIDAEPASMRSRLSQYARCSSLAALDDEAIKQQRHAFLVWVWQQRGKLTLLQQGGKVTVQLRFTNPQVIVNPLDCQWVAVEIFLCPPVSSSA